MAFRLVLDDRARSTSARVRISHAPLQWLVQATQRQLVPADLLRIALHDLQRVYRCCAPLKDLDYRLFLPLPGSICEVSQPWKIPVGAQMHNALEGMKQWKTQIQSI